MIKIIMIMHMFKGFFYCLTVYTSEKIPKITKNAAYFSPIQARGLSPK